MKRTDFIDMSHSVFSFLEDEFRFERKKPTITNFLTSIPYSNKTTGIIIEFDPRDEFIYVALYKLIDGQMKYGQNGGYRFDDLLALKSPNKFNELTQEKKLAMRNQTSAGIERYLTYSASLLREFASDVLRGDFSIFPALYERCANRSYQVKEKLYGNLTEEQRKLL